MSHNPFNDRLDWALQGKRVWVLANSGREYEGILDHVHHQKGSVILHSATALDDGRSLGSVFVRQVKEVAVQEPRKRVKMLSLDAVRPHPRYEDVDFDIVGKHQQMAYRNQFTGGFPVISERDMVIINGHKRIAAAKSVGLWTHACEVVDVNEDERDELFYLAHDHLEPKTEFDFRF